MKANKIADVKLQCPECDGSNVFPLAKLVIGLRVRCEHCGTDLRLSHYREIADQPALWRLESLLDEETGS